MMRKKLFIFMVAIFMIPSMAYSQEKTNSAFNWNKVIDAIIKVESKGNPKAFNPNGDCAGILQITPILVKECNNILKARKSTKRYTLADRYNAKKSKEMFILLQEHFNPEMNIEKVIKQWNCGFYGNGYKYKSQRYLRRVLEHY
jgi:hypothetical protein